MECGITVAFSVIDTASCGVHYSSSSFQKLARQGHKERKGSDERSRLRRRLGVVESSSLPVLFSESLKSVSDFGAALLLVRKFGDEQREGLGVASDP
jgi:hypothetical protein